MPLQQQSTIVFIEDLSLNTVETAIHKILDTSRRSSIPT